MATQEELDKFQLKHPLYLQGTNYKAQFEAEQNLAAAMRDDIVNGDQSWRKTVWVRYADDRLKSTIKLLQVWFDMGGLGGNDHGVIECKLMAVQQALTALKIAKDCYEGRPDRADPIAAEFMLRTRNHVHRE